MKWRHVFVGAITMGLCAGVVDNWIFSDWDESRITALEDQLTAQHEADYATCDLCGWEFARDEGMVVGTGLMWFWRLGQAQADTLCAGSYEWEAPYYHLCPRCVRALRAQLGGSHEDD